MPVGSDPLHGARSTAITNGLARSGFSTLLPSYDAEDPCFLLDHFKEELRKADTVLVDLSGERPSCYFELGFAEALDIPIRLFAFEGTPIHQTGHREAVSFYRSFNHLEDLIALTFDENVVENGS